MTIQEAAHKLLEEAGKPLSTKELARLALDRHLVTSAAKDPVESHAATIHKNIHYGKYNEPELVFVFTPRGRLVGLPNWPSTTTRQSFKEGAQRFKEVRVKVPTDIFDKIRLAEQVKLCASFDDTVVLLLTKGLATVSDDIRKGLMEQLNQLDMV